MAALRGAIKAPALAGRRPRHRSRQARPAPHRGRRCGGEGQGDGRALATRAGLPILLVFGEETPRRSRAVMEALAALPNVETVPLAKGRLALHEEVPDAVAEAVLAVLRR